MPKLTKTKGGLLLFDDFKERNLMWNLTPSDASTVLFGVNGLRMIHNSEYCYLVTQEPSEDYSCIVKVDHIPWDENDIAGVLVLADNKQYAECQTYMAFEPSTLQNQNQFYDYVKGIVQNIVTDSIVLWSENENEPVDVIAGGVTDGVETDREHADPNFVDTIYHYIKVNKVRGRYHFYASPDSYQWIEVGNVMFPCQGTIGLFIYSTEDPDLLFSEENSHCWFNYFGFYRSQFITFHGIDDGYEFEIVDGDGHILVRSDVVPNRFVSSRNSTETLVNTTMLPMPMKNPRLRVFPHDDYTTTHYSAELGEEVWGGDCFYLEKYVELYIDGNLLDQDTLYDLGMFPHGVHFVKISAKNCEDYDLHNVTIQVMQYSEYYDGYRYIKLAEDIGGDPTDSLDYFNEIVIDIPNGGYTNFFMCLYETPEQGPYSAADSYRFKIMIE